MTTPQPQPHLTRAELNRRMVAGELTPTAARDMTIDLYKADPTSAARLVAPDQPSGETWDTTATLRPKTGRGRTPSAGARPAHDAPIVDAPATAPSEDPDGDPDVTSLGAFIASARDDKGLTRTQLGTAIGVRSDIIKAYEEGRRLPSSYMAPRLAAALDVDPDLLRALVEAQGRPQATARRTTRRSTASRGNRSKGKGTGKARGATTGTAAAARVASTTMRPRTTPRRSAPVSAIDDADTEPASTEPVSQEKESATPMTHATRPGHDTTPTPHAVPHITAHAPYGAPYLGDPIHVEYVLVDDTLTVLDALALRIDVDGDDDPTARYRVRAAIHRVMAGLNEALAVDREATYEDSDGAPCRRVIADLAAAASPQS